MVTFTSWSTFQYAFCISLYFALQNVLLIRYKPRIRPLSAVSLKVWNSFNIIKLLKMNYIVSVWPESTLKLFQTAWLTFLADDIRSTNISTRQRAIFLFHIQTLFHLFRHGKDVNNSRITLTSKFVLMWGTKRDVKIVQPAAGG